MSATRTLLLLPLLETEQETLRQWRRIPRSVLEAFGCELLVVVDTLAHPAYGACQRWNQEHPHTALTVIHNQFMRGKGGEQKLGFSFALENGFDQVVVVPFDEGYRPEDLGQLLEALAGGRCDLVIGRRSGNLLNAGVFGSRLASWTSQVLNGSTLRDFHSRYRGYSSQALRRIPFLLNSNHEEFDAEIVLQLLNGKARIDEVPITWERVSAGPTAPTRRALQAMVKNAFHKSGLLWQRRFDPISRDNQHYDLKLGYASSHEWALEAVPNGATVLDIGSGPGGLARELVRKDCQVGVVDQFQPNEQVPDIKVTVQNLDEPPRFDTQPYDYLLMLDVIEHLREPEQFLEQLRRQFDHQAKTLVLTTPNIAFVVQRLMLLLGQFNYGKAGILDRTHTRLLTFRGTKHLLRDAGFEVVELRGVPAPFPKVFGNGWLGRGAVGINLALIRLSKTLFSYQIFVVARSTPDVRFVLQTAVRPRAQTSTRAEAARPRPPRRGNASKRWSPKANG